METTQHTEGLGTSVIAPSLGEAETQPELNLGLTDQERRLANALGVIARIHAGERVELSEVSGKTHGAETVVYVARALRGRMTEM
jgi:hypothetical protein